MTLLLLSLVITTIAGSGVFILMTGIHRVPSGHFGVVYRQYGYRHEKDHNFKKIRAHDSPGFQAETLKADQWYLRPHPIYEVKYNKLIHVPPGTIGVVEAKDGAPPPLTQTLGKHVECNFFQDGKSFLLNGGQEGKQLGILPGGASYAINPELFEVLTVNTIDAERNDLTVTSLKEIRIPEGDTGVVIVFEGKYPDDDHGIGRRVPGHQSFQLPSVFLDGNGQRGVQEETLRPGIYRINPWFAQVELVPSRILVLQWTNNNKPIGNFDSKLDQIRINIEGYWLQFDISQTISIPAEAAPRLVKEFGQQETGTPQDKNTSPVRRFVDRVLSPLVEDYFQNSFGGYQILDFVATSDQVCKDLEDRVRQALATWDVKAISTALHDFEPEGTTLDELRRRRADVRVRREELDHIQQNTEIEELIKKLQLQTERDRRKLDAAVLEDEIRLLGRDNVAMRFFLTELAKMNVPGVIAGNDESLLGYTPLPVAQDMIAKVFGHTAVGSTSAQQSSIPSGKSPEMELEPQLEPEKHDNSGKHLQQQEPSE